jgi:hypothetical protein
MLTGAAWPKWNATTGAVVANAATLLTSASAAARLHAARSQSRGSR